MFRNNERKEVFGLRKYKGYGLTGALIGALMFGVSGTAHANVIENFVSILVHKLGNNLRYLIHFLT